jgi:dTDP-4-amino-4,6-dideoxygalactose transaminase
MSQVPLVRPSLLGREREYVAEVMARGLPASGGRFGARCEALLRETLAARHVFLTSSGTHALEMAGLLLDLRAGDEVIVPGFTFVATANAFALRGARVVFADVDAETLSLDARSVAARLTPQTRALVTVHYGGAPSDLDALGALAAGAGAALVEDNAHGAFGLHRGRALGTVGDFGAFSFHASKNFSCGEGGALVVDSPALAARAEQIRVHGTDRPRFMRGEVAQYTWQELGSSYQLSELQAAFLLGQLEPRERVLARRSQLWARYREELAAWAAPHVRLPPIVAGSTHHIFHLIMPTPERRQALGAHLARRDIEALHHYLPLHLSAMGQRLGGRRGDLPVTEWVCERLLRLPLPNDLTDEEQGRVIDAVRAFVV